MITVWGISFNIWWRSLFDRCPHEPALAGGLGTSCQGVSDRVWNPQKNSEYTGHCAYLYLGAKRSEVRRFLITPSHRLSTSAAHARVVLPRTNGFAASSNPYCSLPTSFKEFPHRTFGFLDVCPAQVHPPLLLNCQRHLHPESAPDQSLIP